MKPTLQTSATNYHALVIMIASDETRHPETEYQQKDVGKETYAQEGKDERAVGQLIPHYR